MEVQNDGTFRLRNFVRGCARYRWMVAAIFSVSVLAALLVAFLTTPVYRGHVLMMPAKQATQPSLADLAGPLGGLTAQLGLGRAPADDLQEGLATLTSRAFIYAFIEDRQLLPVLFDDRWDSAKSQWSVEDPDDIPTLADGYERFDNIMKVSQSLETGLIDLDIEWRDPQLAADWANALVERVNRELRERAIADAQRGMQFLNEQLNQTSIVEVRSAIFSLIESNIQTVMLANVRPEYAFNIIDPAVPPEDYVRPKRLLLLAIGVVFGAFAAGIAVMLRLSATTPG
jgi:uncharacterized protein involved in exopolysaccharide biosynthesis